MVMMENYGVEFVYKTNSPPGLQVRTKDHACVHTIYIDLLTTKCRTEEYPDNVTVLSW